MKAKCWLMLPDIPVGVVFCAFILFLSVIFFSGCSEKTQKPPTIESGEFPFRFTYEINGKTHVIEDIVICEFRGFDYSAWFTKPRSWSTKLKSGADRIVILEFEENTSSALEPSRINIRSSVTLWYGNGEHYMGDPNGNKISYVKPNILYHEYYQLSANEYKHITTPLTHEQAEKLFGIKVIEWDFSEPITNSFR